MNELLRASLVRSLYENLFVLIFSQDSILGAEFVIKGQKSIILHNVTNNNVPEIW